MPSKTKLSTLQNDEVFLALASDTRRAILEELRDEPKMVHAIADVLPVSRPGVSQHLKILKDAGLVSMKKRGTRRIYSINPDGLDAAMKWFSTIGVTLSKFNQLIGGTSASPFGMNGDIDDVLSDDYQLEAPKPALPAPEIPNIDSDKLIGLFASMDDVLSGKVKSTPEHDPIESIIADYEMLVADETKEQLSLPQADDVILLEHSVNDVHTAYLDPVPTLKKNKGKSGKARNNAIKNKIKADQNNEETATKTSLKTDDRPIILSEEKELYKQTTNTDKPRLPKSFVPSFFEEIFSNVSRKRTN